MRATEEVLAQVRAYQTATRTLRVSLDEVDQGLDSFVAQLEENESVAEFLLSAGASGLREELTEAMVEFETTRRRLRSAVLRFGLERGESLSAVARSLGISRQLASRLAAKNS